MANNVTVNLGDFGARLQRDMDLLQRKLQAAKVEAAAFGVNAIVRAAPKAFGQLGQSVHMAMDGQTPEIVIDAPHAAAVELGTRPHMPPLMPLVKWAERIGADNPQRLARAVQLKISRVGTKPTWFVKMQLPKIRDMLKTLLERKL